MVDGARRSAARLTATARRLDQSDGQWLGSDRFRQRELADYRTDADNADLDGLLEQYPDRVTAEVRDILGHQHLWGRPQVFPGFQSG